MSFKIRVSTLPSYFDCPRRAIARLFRQEILDIGYTLNWLIMGVAPLIGTAVHAGAGGMIENKMVTGKPGKLDDATEISIEKFREEILKGVEWDATSPNQNNSEKQIQTLTRSYYHEVQPKIKPTGVEVALTANIGDGFILSGHIDLIAGDIIRDLKTGTRISDCQAQLGGYSLLEKSNHKTNIKQTIMDFLPRVTIDKPYPGAKEIYYDPGMAERVAHNVTMRMKLEVQNFLQTKEAWRIPANPMSIICGPKYCPACGPNSNFCEVK